MNKQKSAMNMDNKHKMIRKKSLSLKKKIQNLKKNLKSINNL